MITLDPDFVGSLAPPSNLTTEITVDGKPSVEVPFARMSRYDRLKTSGQADETEEKDEEEADGSDDGMNKEERKQLKEKRKMRGRNKSLKRLAHELNAANLLAAVILDFCGNNERISLILKP